MLISLWINKIRSTLYNFLLKNLHLTLYMRIFTLLIILLVNTKAFSQNGSVGIGTAHPNEKAVLDLYSTDKGLLTPRLTEVQRNALQANSLVNSELNGLLIYNTTTNKFNVWNISKWDELLTFADVKGAKGDTGLPGPMGLMGPTGPQGVTGQPGQKGDKGDTGPQGAIGPVGIQGPMGSAGSQGAMGLTGLKGEKGDVGIQGPIGLVGSRGPIGLTGVQGVKGDKGDIGIQGPAGGTGKEGPVGMKGEKGDKGDEGTRGLPGLTGATGPAGPVGSAGVQGEKGMRGDKGDKGDAGLQGIKGNPGEQGPQGPQGISGNSFAWLRGGNGTGNIGGTTTPDVNSDFVGTTDDKELILAANRKEGVRIAIDGKVRIGEKGSFISGITKLNLAADLPAISPATAYKQTFIVPGAGSMAAVSISPNIELPDGLVIAYARVVSLNTVEVKFSNVGSVAIDLAPATFFISVIE